MSAADEWKNEIKALLSTSPDPNSLLYDILEISQHYVERLDALANSLAKQIDILRIAESQWMPTNSQESGIIRGPVGVTEDLLESNDIEEIVDRSLS